MLGIIIRKCRYKWHLAVFLCEEIEFYSREVCVSPNFINEKVNMNKSIVYRQLKSSGIGMYFPNHRLISSYGSPSVKMHEIYLTQMDCKLSA